MTQAFSSAPGPGSNVLAGLTGVRGTTSLFPVSCKPEPPIKGSALGSEADGIFHKEPEWVSIDILLLLDKKHYYHPIHEKVKNFLKFSREVFCLPVKHNF